MINGLTVSPIKCFGGKATVSFTISGGTPPYRSCLLQGNQCFSSCMTCNDGACDGVQTFTNVPAGNYELEVTDANGCEAEVSVIIKQPTALNFTTQTSTKACPANTSSLTVTSTGGTPPYMYQLDGGAFQSSNNLGCQKNGTKHTVTVKDANGCTVTAQVKIPS